MNTVSFLVPVYNVEEYLLKCLDSLVGQTWPKTEIVLINDGSTDGSLAICEEYQKKYPQIKIYSYPNSGISKTRNRALAHATGDFVMFVDSDDFIETNMLEVMMETLERENLDIVQCGFRMDYKFGTFYRPGCGRHIFTRSEALEALAAGKYLNNYPWGKLTRRSCFDTVHFPEDMPGFEDTYTIFKSFANAQRIGTVPNRFYHYVQRRGSLTNRMSLNTVYLMRKAYHYQDSWLEKRFPDETFAFDGQYYNTDMVIIYTLIVFCRRHDGSVFVRDHIDFSKLSFPLIQRAAYEAWLLIAKLKLGFGIERKSLPEEERE